MQQYDAVISGAGPAGCSAAHALAQNGHKVLLLDKARFPRDKICGDGISPASVLLLEDLGIIDSVRNQLGPLKAIEGVLLTSPSGTVVQGWLAGIEGREVTPHVIKRKDFDYSLVSSVTKNSLITFMEDTRVIDLIEDENTIKGVTTSNGNYFARIVIAADGIYSPIASRMNLLSKQKMHQGFGIRAYFSGVKKLTSSIEIHYDASIMPGYGWIFPIDNESANVGVGIIHRFTDKRNMKRIFERFISSNTFASAKLQNAIMRKGTLKAYPLPLGSAPGRRSRNNVLLTGDAASFVDPLTGEGIYTALKSGVYAAEAASKAMSEGDACRASHNYEKLWRKEFLFNEFLIGDVYQYLLKNRFLLEKLLERTAKNQYHADLLAAVFGHYQKKITLLKLITPFR